jgi:hypothetical protein
MNGLDGRQQEVVQDLGAQHPLFYLTHHALQAGVPRGPGSSFLPLFTEVRGRGILGSSWLQAGADLRYTGAI